MSFLVEVAVEVALRFAAAFGRDHDAFADGGEGLNHALIRIISFVGDYGIGFDIRKKRVSTVQIVGLAWREMKSRWVSSRINGGMNFGA